ncbi:MAG TPA: RNA-binding transcriptional accessory protein [Candidatus Paenibacillus intestinavium]|nr:RNA-binding transcriptional accessory protein [Candidatus Paenibacillus intestinavium]
MEQNVIHMISEIAKQLNIPQSKVKSAVSLLDEGNTIPFIARYRKEMTGELDENQLRDIEEKLQYMRNLESRKQEVLRLIEEQGKLTDELALAINKSVKLQEVEDLYRPYRQKRKTRASVAKEKGLEPLAEWLLAQNSSITPLVEAARYIDAEKGVESAEDALAGAKDIIAEQLADDAKIRTWVRTFTFSNGILKTVVKDAQTESVYEMYYNYQEPISKLPPHRILAINRGEREEILKVSFALDSERIEQYMHRQTVKRDAPSSSGVIQVLQDVIIDAYKRLLAPSIEREVRTELTDKAEVHAIDIFSENLRNLLLQPPVRGKRVLGVDPAFRTGCKLAVIDDIGKMLEVGVCYPTAPHHKTAEAEKQISKIIDTYDIELIVIGNGTASRETEQFIAALIKNHAKATQLKYIIVNEAGASVYSASKLAAEEFPELDVAERSAVSIARRLQDPLAELVKIEPKAIGVGQYQHDVSQKRLDETLTGVVESAVNHVGVDVNTASASLLSYVAGINGTIAKNIVKYRDENGRFVKRAQLQKVPRLGAKSFEQCVGFLRIAEGEQLLDNTPIHPESYHVVKALLKELGMKEQAVGSEQLASGLKALNIEETAAKLEVGVPTMKDIVDSLLRPGRDPREELPAPIFHTDVLNIEDLTKDMELHGTVRNVIDFGAFVDIGLKNDGLVHISQLSDRFVKHPMDVVSVGDTVTVWVLEVDMKRNRVGLTMKKPR